MNNLTHSRTLAAWLFAAALLLASAGSALAAVRYVDVNNTGAMWPYTSWATAASGIQEAIEIAVAGDEIVVTNGTYSVGGRSTIGQSTTTNRVVVDKPLALRSVNGPQSTLIDGGGVFRCVYLTNGASLSGFTLTNGRAPVGGGLWCESTNAMVSNCVVSGNSSFGSIRFLNVGSSCCNLYHTFAGGAYGGTLYYCTLSDNRAETHSFLGHTCDSTTCRTVGDGNIQTYYSSGAGGGAANAALNSCTLTANWADSGGGAYGCTLNNCTLAGNSGGYGGAYSSTLNNCIVYFNDGGNYDPSSTLNYSCTTPLPTNGVGNITNAPGFVNLAVGNYRLRPDSPCIDAGTNLSAIITNDLDGRPRPLDGNGDGLAAFDIGAYEYRTPLLVWQDSPNPAPPHADWSSAAHTIQAAVDAAVAGDEIVVTNGIYATGERTVDGFTTNRVAVDKPLTLRTANGPEFTIIDGGGVFRCVYLANGASISSFTLVNGLAERGAGLACESGNAVAFNCVLAGNYAYFIGGGAFGGTLRKCALTGNLAYGSYGFGGGAYGCTLNDCTLTGNQAWPFSGGGTGGGAAHSLLNNCTLIGNLAKPGNSGFSSGYGGGAAWSTLNNCTLSGNRAEQRVGDHTISYGGGAYSSSLNNCILYLNDATFGENYWDSTLNYSCTTPLPTNGVGNITNAPLFVDLASGNLRLQSNSPCINAGLNAFAPAGPDLDGLPRIVSGSVDMGAYEYQFDSTGGIITLVCTAKLPGGEFQFTFIGAPSGIYTVLMKTAMRVPWTVLGPATEVAPGLFTFHEEQATNGPQRFYAVVNEFWPIETRACPGAGPNPCPCEPGFYRCIISRNGTAIWQQTATGLCPCPPSSDF